MDVSTPMITRESTRSGGPAPSCHQAFAVVIFGCSLGVVARRALGCDGVRESLYPKSRRLGASRSRWSQNRSLFALPGLPRRLGSGLRLRAVCFGVALFPRRECCSVLAVVKAIALRVAFGQP